MLSGNGVKIHDTRSPHTPRGPLVAYNTAAQIVGKIISSGATLLITLIVARSYGVDGYGEFTKIITYASVFYLLSDFGLNAIFIQRTNKEGSTIDEFPYLLSLRLALGSLLAFLAIAVLALLPEVRNAGYSPLVRLGIIVFVPTILFQALITTVNAFFQKKLRYDAATIAILAGSIVALVSVWISGTIFQPEAGLVASVGAIGFGSLVTAVTGLLLAWRLGAKRGITWSTPVATQYLKQSLPLGLTLLFNVVYFRFDAYVLAFTRPTAEVGFYGLAYKAFEVALVIPTFAMNVIYPLLVASGPSDFLRVLHKALVGFGILSVLTTAGMWLGAPLLTLVRPDFWPAIAALRVLALGLPWFFLTSLFMWALIAKKQQWALLGIYGVSMVINIIATLIVIPRYGFMGAAWVTVVSEFFLVLATGWVLATIMRSRKLQTFASSE